MPGGPLRLHGLALALLLAAGVVLSCAPAQATPSAQAQAQGKTKPKSKSTKTSTASTSAAAGMAASGTPEASNLAPSEQADIADLRRRLAARSVTLTRHAEVDDIAIQVWSRTGMPKKFYVAVTQKGTVRRTLTANEEADAWRSYDSFRRMAGLGEVGRPVLLGQQMPALAAMPRASEPSPRTPEEAPMAAREISATTGETVDPTLGGYAVDTLRRARIGDEVARLVWSAESKQYFVALTRQGSVVVMLRSRDAAEATRAYEDYVRQAESRAALLQGRTAGAVSAAGR